MIAWTDPVTHGRGPAFRSRAERRRRRQLRAARLHRERVTPVETIDDVLAGRARAVFSGVNLDPIVAYSRPSWFVRSWRRILAVLGYGPFGGR